MATFDLKDGIALKTFDGPWSEKEFKLAKAITNSSDIYCKIYEHLSPKQYTHEWLGKVTPLQEYIDRGFEKLTKDWAVEADQVLHRAFQVCTEHRNIMYEFNKNKDARFYYSDFTMYNIVVKSNLEIKIIDIDSFVFDNVYKNRGSTIDTLFHNTLNTVIGLQQIVGVYKQ